MARLAASRMSWRRLRSREVKRHRRRQNRLLPDWVAAMLDGPARQKVNVPPKNLSQLILHVDVIEQTPLRVFSKRNQHIHITVAAEFTRPHRAPEQRELRHLPLLAELAELFFRDVDGEGAHRSRGGAVAFFVLLARAAGTGVVAADFRLGAFDGGGGFFGGAGEGQLLFGRLGREGALDALHFRFFGRAAGNLHLPEDLHHAILDALHHFLEELERFLLVLDQRIALAVAAQADAFLEVIDVEEVILPLLVDDLQEQILFVEAHVVCADRRFLLLVAFVDGVDDLCSHVIALHGVEIGARASQIEAEVVVQLRVQLGLVRMLAIAFRIVRVDEEAHDLVGGVEDVLLPLAAFEDGAAQRVDRLTLLVHHVVVFEEVLAGLEVAALDLLLRALDRARDHAVLDRHAFLHAQALHDAHDPVAAENAHQIVFEREIKTRGAWIALASGAAAQLVVDAARLVALGTKYVQPAEVDHFFVIAIPLLANLFFDLLPFLRLQHVLRLLRGEELRVAAEEDVRSAAGHVRGDRDRALASGLRDDLRFALVILRVQHHGRHALFLEQR